AFVIDIQRSAAPGHGAIVDDGALFAGHSLADQSCEGRRFLAVEISLQTVADGFMQQHSGPSRSEDDFHLACRRLTGIELQNRLTGRLFGKKLRILVPEKEI